MTETITPRRRGFLVALNSVVRHFGVCVIPVAEIVRMESESTDCYEAMKRHAQSRVGERSHREQLIGNHGYFNGLADYAGKTANMLRCHYLPNKKLSNKG
jgi:hypothetical protein